VQYRRIGSNRGDGNHVAEARETAPILFVTLSLERGGTERHLAEIMPRLKSRGWPVALYCLATRGAMAEEVAAAGVEVIAPPIDGSAWFRGILAPLRLATTAAALGWLMVARRPRIVHAFLPLPYLVAGPLAVLTARPIRIMSRRNLADYQSKRPLLRRLEIALHGWMTAVLGNSHRIGDELLAEGIARERLGVIHNGVDTARFGATADKAHLRARLGVAADALVGVIVANLNPYKGHADLIRALAGVRGRLGERWVILAAGRDDGHGRALSALAEELGIAGNIRFLGSRTDVPDLVRAADFALNVSHEEGFSNAVIEGMAAALPMIVTDVGGNPEAVVDGETGLVVPPRDPVALGEAIAWLAGNREAAAAMGEAGAERVRRTFTIEACVDHYDALYRGLLAGEPAGKLAPHRPGRTATA
jgi:glycosyltransferase involved in cell wall biosynthesis